MAVLSLETVWGCIQGTDMSSMQDGEFHLEFTEAARRLWLQINQVSTPQGIAVLDYSGRSLCLHMQLCADDFLMQWSVVEVNCIRMQINAFGPDCHAGGQPLYEIFTEAVQLLQKLQYSPYPLVPFSRTW